MPACSPTASLSLARLTALAPPPLLAARHFLRCVYIGWHDGAHGSSRVVEVCVAPTLLCSCFLHTGRFVRTPLPSWKDRYFFSNRPTKDLRIWQEDWTSPCCARCSSEAIRWSAVALDVV